MLILCFVHLRLAFGAAPGLRYLQGWWPTSPSGGELGERRHFPFPLGEYCHYKHRALGLVQVARLDVLGALRRLHAYLRCLCDGVVPLDAWQLLGLDLRLSA